MPPVLRLVAAPACPAERALLRRPTVRARLQQNKGSLPLAFVLSDLPCRRRPRIGAARPTSGSRGTVASD
jgi:hypothetical protein